MRLAMIAAVLVLAACGGNGTEKAGPERRTAAGEVLGGEASDAMIPLDTVRSSSPAAPPPAAAGSSAPRTPGDRDEILPQPEVRGGPEPMSSDPAVEDAPSPPQP